MARKKHRRWWLFLVVLVLAGLLFWYAWSRGWLDSARRALANAQPGLYHVVYAVDGDTIVINMNGHEEKVRFIGVDTPETHKPNTPVQCYGPAAAAFTKNAVGNHRVRLVADALSTNRDRYGRLLRYVYLPDGTNLDEKLVQEGYGFYYPYFPFSLARQFAKDEQTAIKAKRGLWAACQPKPTDQGGYVSNPA